MKEEPSLWILEKHSDGSFIIKDEKQEVVGHFKNAEIMATHFIFSIKRLREIEIERKKLRKFAHDHAICLRMQIMEERGVVDIAKLLLADLEELLGDNK